MAYSFKATSEIPFKVIGYIPAGLPNFELPKFSLTANETDSGNDEGFFEIVSEMGSGLIVVPLISLMENIAICKAFGEFSKLFKSLLSFLLCDTNKSSFHFNSKWKASRCNSRIDSDRYGQYSQLFRSRIPWNRISQ